MTCSSLAEVSIPSPNRYSPRAYGVSRVTVHHMAGNLSVETCGSIFASASRGASSNYGVDSFGRVACYVDEDDAAWTSSSYDNDNRAITIEVADEDTANWVPSEAAYESTVKLCADICNRYGITPTYTGDTRGSFTEHMMFAATGCPGPWWHAKMPQFIQDVRQAMEGDDMPSAQEVAEAVWGYNYKGTARLSNMYDVDNVIYDKVANLEKQVAELSAKIDKLQVGGVDVKAIAKAVNDDVASRMKS